LLNERRIWIKRGEWARKRLSLSVGAYMQRAALSSRLKRDPFWRHRDEREMCERQRLALMAPTIYFSHSSAQFFLTGRRYIGVWRQQETANDKDARSVWTWVIASTASSRNTTSCAWRQTQRLEVVSKKAIDNGKFNIHNLFSILLVANHNLNFQTFNYSSFSLKDLSGEKHKNRMLYYDIYREWNTYNFWFWRERPIVSTSQKGGY